MAESASPALLVAAIAPLSQWTPPPPRAATRKGAFASAHWPLANTPVRPAYRSRTYLQVFTLPAMWPLRLVVDGARRM